MNKYQTFLKILKNSGPIRVHMDKETKNMIISFTKRKPITLTYGAFEYFAKHHVNNDPKMVDKILTLRFVLFLVENKLI